MVLPISDDNSDLTTFPVVNLSLIALNVLMFLLVQGMGTNERLTYALSVVPEKIVTGQDFSIPDVIVTDPLTGQRYLQPGIPPTPISVYLTLLTSMFLHGGFLHLAGNMLFLYIFGDNVEDTLGHWAYLAFYLICGVLAALAHVGVTYASGADPRIPCLGASGAISGVLGGYLLLFPTRRVTVILFRILADVPAWVAIGIWFAFQLISSLGALGEGSRGGGVAYGAHVGGFVAGLLLVHPFRAGRPPPPTVSSRSPDWYSRWD